MNIDTKKVVCVLCLAGSLWAQSAVAPAPDYSTESASKQQETKQDLLWQRFDSRVTRITKGLNGVAGVAIVDLTSGRQLLINADHVSASASTIKLAILAELYRQSQEGGPANLADSYVVRASDLVPDSYILGGLTPGVTRLTNRDLATMMVAVSDNSAANILMDHVGIDNVNRMLRSLGITRTSLRRKMMDSRAAQEGRENVTTPRDLARLLEAIYSGKLLNSAMKEDLFKVLSTPKDSWIPRLLPDSVTIANKPGSLDGIRNDAGIIFLQGHPFIVSVMTSYLHNDAEGEHAISEITHAAFEYFDVVGATSNYGRVMSPLHTH